MFKDNPDFYPTTESLIIRMYNKLPKNFRQSVRYWLEPQAGAGDIAEFIRDKNRYRGTTIHTIEKDPELAATLRGKGFQVVDYDFLNFNGPDKYDVIIGNPPFSEGDKHLLKAINIMYCGHIIYLLNAETLKNPFSNTRKMLAQKLDELNADVEYLRNQFITAERKTGVEVALVHIHVDRQIEQDLFDGVTETIERTPVYRDAHKQREITQKSSIKNLVAEYDRAVKIGTETLLNFFKNYHHVSPYMDITVKDSDRDNGTLSEASLTENMKWMLNKLVKQIRTDFWRKTLQLDKVRDRMTVKKLAEFNKSLQENTYMDFTESNIRTFILNLVNSYEEILTDAVLDTFELMTVSHAWHEDLHLKNIHYFSGWKTNKAYSVNKKVILPFYDWAFFDDRYGNGRWSVDYTVKPKLDDIDKVANYFDGQTKYVSIVNALTTAFRSDQTKKVLSTYFEITVFKKGTIHLTFRDEGILRRFNVTACKGKSWLPEDYGSKKYNDLSAKEKKTADEFEGEQAYSTNVTTDRTLFRNNPLPQIGI